MLFAFCVPFFVVGNPQRSENCNQINLSGSSSSLASETSNKNSGQRSYGIGGAYLQKKIQQMTSRTAERSISAEKKDSEDARDETETSYKPRKRMRSPFRRIRDRSFSRERLASAPDMEAESMPERDRSGKPKDVDSNVLQPAVSHGNRSSRIWLCPQLRHKRRKTIWLAWFSWCQTHVYCLSVFRYIKYVLCWCILVAPFCFPLPKLILA